MLDPKKYVYLWTDYDVNFIFTSCYLFPKFKSSDIVLIYDFKNKGLKFFISKKDVEKYSDYGVEFYTEHFSEWKKAIKNNIEKGKNIIKKAKSDNPHKMTNDELKDNFLSGINLFQSLGENYFYTEFFFLEKVEDLSKKSKILIANLVEMGKIKLEARKVLNQFYNYDNFFSIYIEEVSKKFGREDVQWLSFQEILDLLGNKSVPLSNRDNKFWILTKENDWDIIIGDEAEMTLKKFDNFFFNFKSKIIKGTSASKGICKGKIKVLRTLFSSKINEEIKKVETGDVLVAETTGPEMMPACAKAAAIITEEGGLTSHAAITSRELNIPCIVGAKNATKMFKDGDLVEVDADKGIIRKIKGQ